jgi:hypothetical protein
MISRDDIRARYDAAIRSTQLLVSPFGDVEGPEERITRRDRALVDYTYFKQTYFPNYARQAEPSFAGELARVCEIRNRPQLVLGFRGCGKSTDISLIRTIWEILRGSAHFFIFFSRSESVAIAEYTAPIKAICEANVRITNDFGKIAVNGELGDFTANGVRVLARGIGQGFRGLRHGAWRPDRLRGEDFEDSSNRMSPAMVKKFLGVLTQDVMKSVGEGVDEQWSFVINANYFSRRSLIHALRMSRLFDVTLIPKLRSLAQGETHPDAIDGEVSTWPERYPTRDIVDFRAAAPTVHRTEDQQEPQDDEALFRREWFHLDAGSYDASRSLGLFGWIDPSPGQTGAADYKAYGIGDFIMVDGELHMHLVEARVRRETVNQMIAGIFDMHHRHPSTRLWAYESVGSEFYLERLIAEQGVRYGGSLPLMGLGNLGVRIPWKKDRIPQMQSVLERGLCHLRGGSTDDERIITQYIDWPEGLHDDGPDMHSGLYRIGEIMTIGQSVVVVL